MWDNRCESIFSKINQDEEYIKTRAELDRLRLELHATESDEQKVISRQRWEAGVAVNYVTNQICYREGFVEGLKAAFDVLQINLPTNCQPKYIYYKL